VELKSEVITVVNRDYAQFVQLSAKIDGFETAIHRLKPPLATVLRRLSESRDALQAQVQEYQAALLKRNEWQSARQLLQDFVRAHELLHKAEAALPSMAAATRGKGGVADAGAAGAGTAAARSDAGAAPGGGEDGDGDGDGGDIETACARLLRTAHWFSTLAELSRLRGHLAFFRLQQSRLQVRVPLFCRAHRSRSPRRS
jgi:hypothetical protein